MVEDKLLIWKCKRGNRTAFRRIYEKYEGDLRTLAANLLDDKAVAEDVVHDVFISFLQAVNRLELKSSLAGYLKTSVANRARDYMRKKKPQAVSSNEFQSIVSHDHWPLQLVVKDEETEKLCAAMSQLPYEHREAVTLRLHGQMKLKTIAEIQKTSVKTAHTRYRSGLEELKRVLDSEIER